MFPRDRAQRAQRKRRGRGGKKNAKSNARGYRLSGDLIEMLLNDFC